LRPLSRMGIWPVVALQLLILCSLTLNTVSLKKNHK
jgi:hypothetical protein